MTTGKLVPDAPRLYYPRDPLEEPSMPDGSPMTECTQDGTRPSPDPTILTTEALQRAINSLHEIISREVTHECESRVAADLAIQAFNKRELQLIEGQRVEQKLDTKAAVDAALAAAKEAVKEQTTASGLSISKSENATNEQLKQLGATFTTAIAGVDRTINDWKDRVNKVEQSQATHAAQQGGEAKGTDKMMPWVFAIIAAVVAVVSIIIQFSH